jgi:hypothetical protein
LLAWWKEREPQYKAVAERRRRAAGTIAPVAAAAPVSVGSVGVPGELDDQVEPPVRPRASSVGVPGPPAVPRQTIQARPRQQRGKKRK